MRWRSEENFNAHRGRRLLWLSRMCCLLLTILVVGSTTMAISRRAHCGYSASSLGLCASSPLRMPVGVYTGEIFVAAMGESRAFRLGCCPRPVAFLEVQTAAVVLLHCSTQLELWYRCLATIHHPKFSPLRLCAVPVCLSGLARWACAGLRRIEVGGCLDTTILRCGCILFEYCYTGHRLC